MDEIDVINIIKAIITSYGGEIRIEDLEGECEMWAQESIPYLKLGYYSFLDFLRNHPEIKMSKNALNESVFVLAPITESNSINLTGKIVARKNDRRNRRYMPYRKTRPDVSYTTTTPSVHSYTFKDSSCSDLSFEDEISQCDSNTEITYSDIDIDPYESMEAVHEPIINGQQLIGDDFFLQIATENLNSSYWRKSENSALYIGLCVSGQTIKACTERLRNITSISNKVTLMLGSVDIYQGRTLQQMKQDYLELLDVLETDFNLLKSSITIGTIPPLANVSCIAQYKEYITLVSFNNWLRQLVYRKSDAIKNKPSQYNIIDFHRDFSKDIDETSCNFFQESAKNVSGTRHSYVLFNIIGRALAVSLFFMKTLYEYNYFPPCDWTNNSNHSSFIF